MNDRVAASAGARLLGLWERCRRLPLGGALFGLALARTVPYSASIGARVLELAPGHARVALPDRRAVRNHLASIHAVALANLGELTSGLAMTTALPPRVRAIVVALEVEYQKKARGRIVATSDVALPPILAELEHEVHAEMRDASDQTVARITVRWRIGPA
jgi:acyl-coenzyme A thioesterase PaaI-like protein